MAYINVSNITFDKSVRPINNSFNLTVRFDCLKPIKEEIEWKFIFVGNSHDPKYDQELDVIAMSDLEFGVSEFAWEVKAPNYSLVPDINDILDSTIIMITGSYKNKKFFRCSYLIRQFYQEEALEENPPDNPKFDKLYREIKVEKPIIKVYELVWEDKDEFNGTKLSEDKFEEIDMFADNDEKDDVGAKSALEKEQVERNETLKAMQDQGLF